MNMTRHFSPSVIFTMIPLAGEISCGRLRYAEDEHAESYPLPSSLVVGGKFYMLRACGDSMTGAGIKDGDLVLIRQQDTAENGQIVVARIGDETTLKRLYYKRDGKIYLHPENSSMNDIVVDRCAIQGVAVKVIKDVS